MNPKPVSKQVQLHISSIINGFFFHILLRCTLYNVHVSATLHNISFYSNFMELFSTNSISMHIQRIRLLAVATLTLIRSGNCACAHICSCLFVCLLVWDSHAQKSSDDVGVPRYHGIRGRRVELNRETWNIWSLRQNSNTPLSLAEKWACIVAIFCSNETEQSKLTWYGICNGSKFMIPKPSESQSFRNRDKIRFI